MKHQNQGGVGFGWPGVWRLLGSLCIPLAILPWLINRFRGETKQKCARKLKDKVVLITGASSGLGEALAHEYYSVGCKVILAARRENELERVKENLMVSHSTATTHPPVVLPLDLSDINSIPQYVAKALSIHGHIDILVNNAGMTYRGTILNTNIDVDIKLMVVNYFGQIALTKAVLPSMVERKSGHIVVVGSVQSLLAIPYRSAYAASKHALQAFCDTLRAEVASHNIKVTAANPGYINTSFSINAITGDGKSYGSDILVQRPEELESKIQRYNKTNGIIKRHFRRDITQDTKLRIHNMISKVIFRNRSEVWTIKSRNQQRLEVEQMRSFANAGISLREQQGSKKELGQKK